MSDIKTGGKPRRVLVEPDNWTRNQIVAIEGHYDADFVCETCIRGKNDQWVNMPLLVFYQDEDFRIPPGGSPYFGIYERFDHTTGKAEGLYICNAISAVEDFTGVVADNGDVVYSRYRHDFRRSPDESVWIDGGRDYLRYNGRGELVTLRIVGKNVEIVA